MFAGTPLTASSAPSCRRTGPANWMRACSCPSSAFCRSLMSGSVERSRKSRVTWSATAWCYATIRHGHPTGCRPGRGADLACSLWLATSMSSWPGQGGARRVQRLLALRNDVSLLAEEYDGGNHRQLGIFRSVFAHRPCQHGESVTVDLPGVLSGRGGRPYWEGLSVVDEAPTTIRRVRAQAPALATRGGRTL